MTFKNICVKVAFLTGNYNFGNDGWFMVEKTYSWDKDGLNIAQAIHETKRLGYLSNDDICEDVVFGIWLDGEQMDMVQQAQEEVTALRILKNSIG